MQRRGFTLVEVLVALALMAVLAGLAWRGIGGVASAKRASDERVEQTLRLGTVLAQWEQDLALLHDSGLVPAIGFDGKTLRLVRRQEGGLQVVAWALREGGRWTRWATPPTIRGSALQDDWLRSQQLLGNEPEQLTLVENVQSWQIYFYRDNAWSNAQSSAGTAAADAAPPPANPASAPAAAPRTPLPQGVRIVIGLPAGALTRDVLVPPQL